MSSFPPELESVHLAVARMIRQMAELNTNGMVRTLEADRRATALAVLDELEREASGLTVARTVAEPEPLRIAMARLRERYG